MASIKSRRSMKIFLKDMAGLKGTLGPKRGLIAWVPNEKESYLGHPWIGKLYHSHSTTSNNSMKVP